VLDPAQAGRPFSSSLFSIRSSKASRKSRQLSPEVKTADDIRLGARIAVVRVIGKVKAIIMALAFTVSVAPSSSAWIQG
jgi:hypothetical protein